MLRRGRRVTDEDVARGLLPRQLAAPLEIGEPHRDGWTPPLTETTERVAWWAEIFETPCVAYAARLDDVATLAAAGADFVALGDALWSAPSLEQAVAAAQDAARKAAAARAETHA